MFKSNEYWYSSTNQNWIHLTCSSESTCTYQSNNLTETNTIINQTVEDNIILHEKDNDSNISHNQTVEYHVIIFEEGEYNILQN